MAIDPTKLLAAVKYLDTLDDETREHLIALLAGYHLQRLCPFEMSDPKGNELAQFVGESINADGIVLLVLDDHVNLCAIARPRTDNPERVAAVDRITKACGDACEAVIKTESDGGVLEARAKAS